MAAGLCRGPAATLRASASSPAISGRGVPSVSVPVLSNSATSHSARTFQRAPRLFTRQPRARSKRAARHPLCAAGQQRGPWRRGQVMISTAIAMGVSDWCLNPAPAIIQPTKASAAKLCTTATHKGRLAARRRCGHNGCAIAPLRPSTGQFRAIRSVHRRTRGQGRDAAAGAERLIRTCVGLRSRDQRVRARFRRSAWHCRWRSTHPRLRHRQPALPRRRRATSMPGFTVRQRRPRGGVMPSGPSPPRCRF